MHLSRKFKMAITDYAKEKYPDQFRLHTHEEISILRIKPSTTSMGSHVVWILADGDKKVRQLIIPLEH